MSEVIEGFKLMKQAGRERPPINGSSIDSLLAYIKSLNNV